MSVYEFGQFQLDSAERVLRKGNRPVPLTPKAFDTLVLLVQNQGRLLDKDTILQTVWPDTFVEEATLTQNIFTLRKALGETNGGTYFIETVPKRGYRFVAQVHEMDRDETTSRERAVTQRAWGIPIRRNQARWIAASAILILAVSIGWLLRLGMGDPGSTVAPAAGSIAVLPFKPLSNDLTDEYLGLAMADALITKLGNIRQVIVRPTTAIRKYTKPEKEPVKAGQELGVESVLDGNILRSGDRVRVTVQLFRVRDGASIWGATFDIPSTDIFTLQDRVSEQVAQALMNNVTGARSTELIERHTENARAYEAYLKGRYFWNKRTAPSYQRAIQHFELAIREDPQFALAYSGLADAYALLSSMPNETVPRSVGMSRAREAALKALQLDPDLAEAHTSLAFIKMHYDWDFPAAEREFNKALELNPGYSTAHHWYAYYLLAMMRVDQALAQIRQAHQLDPLSLIISADVDEIAGIYLQLGDEKRFWDLMEQAYRDRTGGLILLNIVDWGPLEDHPRMKDLIRRVGLS